MKNWLKFFLIVGICTPGHSQINPPRKALVTIFLEGSGAFNFNYADMDKAPPGGWIKRPIIVDGKTILVLLRDRFATFEINPGEHEFKTSDADAFKMNLVSGEHVFLRPKVIPTKHRMNGQIVLEEVPCEEAIRRGKDTKPAKNSELQGIEPLQEIRFPITCK